MSESRLRQSTAPAFKDHYNAAQLRFDTWHRLKEDLFDIVEHQARGDAFDDLLERVGKDLKVLASIEFYTAFPSKADLAYLNELLASRQYLGMAQAASRLVRALMSHAYRRHRIDITSPETDDLREEHEALAEHDDGRETKPYFEVLIVDELTTLEEGAIRDGFKRVRRNEDKFIYDTVVVPSFEDALFAI